MCSRELLVSHARDFKYMPPPTVVFVDNNDGKGYIADDMGPGKLLKALASMTIYHNEWMALLDHLSIRCKRSLERGDLKVAWHNSLG